MPHMPPMPQLPQIAQIRRSLQEALSSRATRLLWLERLLWVVGLLCLGMVAYAVIDARWYALVQGRRLDQALQAARAARRGESAAGGAAAAPGAPGASGGEAAGAAGAAGTTDAAGAGQAPASQTDRLDSFRPGPAAPPPLPAEEGSLIGRVEIPRVGISTLVIEGVTGPTLRRGVGHIPGTALPQQPGNVGLAGHRDTVFRALKDIRKDDAITLDTLAGSYQYMVDWTKVVDPGDVVVLAASGRPELTLVTCYPFYFVGSAPRRFVVRAHLVDPVRDPGVAAPARAAGRQPAH